MKNANKWDENKTASYEVNYDMNFFREFFSGFNVFKLSH